MGLISVRPTLCWDLTDVTLADEDSNSIPTDDVNGQSQAMWQCKWRHLVAKIETNASWKKLKKIEEKKIEKFKEKKITQVLNLIPWVGCASGNVF